MTQVSCPFVANNDTGMFVAVKYNNNLYSITM